MVHVGHDGHACTARKVAVSNTPGVLTDTTADLALALLLATARRVCEGGAYARAGKYQGWAPLLFLGSDVHHKTLGILGLGRVGLAVAQRAAGFDMKILYHSAHRRPPEVEQKVGAMYVDQETLLQESDFISLHVPLTPQTRHLLGPAQFALMKPTAYVINTARGEVIDEAALARAINSGQIAGAGLDVFENEPAIHPDLAANPSVVLLPHIGSASIETRTAMGLLDHANLRACLIEGRTPPNCLNPEVFD